MSDTVAGSSATASSSVERGRPVERLGDARRLEQVLLAQRLHEMHDLLRQALADARHLGAHDRELALGVGIADPVIEAAALQRVVDLARAVRGDDDDRRMRRLHRAELGDRDLEVGQHLEQERLEGFVGAVELVDQQHRRAVGIGLERLQQRPLDEEAAPRTRRGRAGRGRRRPRPPRGGSRSSARRSSTRRRRRRRRGPRSTAAGSAAGRASPTAPWRSRSCRRRPRLRETAAGPCVSARNSTVASDRSAT